MLKKNTLWKTVNKLLLLGVFFLFTYCVTPPATESTFHKPQNSSEYYRDKDSILLTFAGDIMAHRPNYSTKPYSAIYADIEKYLKESTLSFANLETPVTETRECSSYPEFNVHQDYALSAIEAGFNVFSLSNNHTSDQGLEGIKSTRDFFKSTEDKTKKSLRPIFACGIKDSKNGPLTYRVIPCISESGELWNVLFMAVTEVINRPDNKEWYDYIPPKEREREEFIENISELKKTVNADLFVLSFHTSEPEYVREIQKGQREFYYKLLENGVDVLWANHPHVAKEWEAVSYNREVPSKIVFFAQGNTISAQRWEPDFSNPQNERDYTGDGYITQVRFIRNSEKKIQIAVINPILITTYITPKWQFVIKVLDENFIASLKDGGQKNWAAYMEQRKKLMEKIKGKTTWL